MIKPSFFTLSKALPVLAALTSLGALGACDSGQTSSDEGPAAAAGSPPASAGAGPSGSGAPNHAGAGNIAGSGSAAGATGAAGAAGGAGVPGSAGSAGILIGTGGPFPFPQNKKPGACTLTTTANASGSVQAAYTSWKAAFVTSSGAGSGLRVQRNTDGDDTVSEGIGYGMIAAAYLADKATFDGLWAYAKSHLDANGLMNWKIDAGGTVTGMGSAADADEDVAWALLMASNQWSSATYLADGRKVIQAIYDTTIAGDGMLKPGDNWGGTSATYPDYFSPAYFRVFAKVMNNANWSGAIIDRNYEILDKVSGQHGLVPDTTSSTYEIPAGKAGTYSYDACRTPWRIAMDYCFNAEPRAKAYLDKVGPFFDGVGANNIGDGYSLTGSQTSSNKNMAFIGPAGVAGMVGHQALLDGAFAFGASNGGGDTSYYGQSLRLISMLMMSGNFVDFSKQ
jgi:endo-1,4-beta-D-glucanase Y